MTEYETDLLAELIGRKQDCLLQLRQMGKKQLEFVREGRMTALLDVLSQKQRMIGNLQQVERALDPFRTQDPGERLWRSAEMRQTCAGKLATCESLLREILAGEKQSEGELTQRRDDTAKQLQGAHLAGQARGAYTTTAQPGASRIDLSSES